MNEPNPRQAGQRQESLPPIPTSRLLLYLATVVAWEAELGTLVLRFLGGIVLAPVWRYSILAFSVLVTILAIRVSRHDWERLRMSRGNVQLTARQVVVVIFVMVSLGATIAVVASSINQPKANPAVQRLR